MTTLTLTERALAAHVATEVAYRKAQERLRREDEAQERDRLALLMKQVLGIEDVEVIPALPSEEGDAYPKCPTAVVEGLTFTLIRSSYGDHDLGVFVPCPRCGDEVLELVSCHPPGIAALGRILTHPQGHRGMCPRDLNEDGEPKDRPQPQPAKPTAAERLADAVRMLIYEEMEERGV